MSEWSGVKSLRMKSVSIFIDEAYMMCKKGRKYQEIEESVCIENGIHRYFVHISSISVNLCGFVEMNIKYNMTTHHYYLYFSVFLVLCLCCEKNYRLITHVNPLLSLLQLLT